METITPRLQDAVVTVAKPEHALEVLAELAEYQLTLLRLRRVKDEDLRFFVEEAFNDIIMVVDGDASPWIIDNMNWHYSWIPEGGVNVYLEILLSLQMPSTAALDEAATYNRYLCMRYWPSTGEFDPVQGVVHATSDSEPEWSEILEMLSG